MLLGLFILWLFFPSPSTASLNLTSLFGPGLSLGAEIILPGSHDWESKTQARWSDYTAPTYIGAIKPVTELDIQNTVKIAQSNGISFLATGGGHSFSDYSNFEGISIDLGNFRSTKFNQPKTLLTVGGGVKYDQLAQLLYDAKKELPLGSCGCPGVVGSTLGAGLGPLMGHRGLIIDALESVRLVTANGNSVTASQTQNAGLFWGIRGAGSNFGIVVSATFKVWDITSNGRAMTAGLVFPTSTNSSYWRVLQTFDIDMPSRLSLTNMAFSDRETNQSYIVLNAIYFGAREEGEQHIERFRRLGPIRDTVQMVPQNKLFPPILGSCTPHQNINIYTAAVRRTGPDTLESVFSDMNTFWRRHSGYQGRLLFPRIANDAAAMVPRNETSFPWRKAIAHISIEGYMTDTSIYVMVDEFERSLRDRIANTSGYSTLAAYVGYARGSEGPESWYSSKNLPRLSALKQQWDPDGLFRFNKPIPLPPKQVY